MLYSQIPVYFLLLGCALCAPERVQPEHEAEREHDALAQSEHDALAQADPERLTLEKRSSPDFGLGKRAYSYVSEYKRLPVYNFGLGKRSRPYSFGLGKRSVDEDADAEEFANYLSLAEMLDQYEDPAVNNENMKRARPYAFGLGKRFAEDEAEEKRARMYDFGLGKRLPLYNFGLGKRARASNVGKRQRDINRFNFGLGKRQRDMNRFNFGLGKRSVEEAALDDSDNYFDV